MNKHFSVLILIIQIITFHHGIAQVKVFEVKQTIEKEFEIDADVHIVLNANKADVNIYSSAIKTVQVKVILSSKNKEKQTALKDLNLLKLIAEKKGNSISLTNYLEIGQGNDKPTSTLHAHYNIIIPKSMMGKLKVTNNFGTISLKKIELNALLESKFCQIKLTDYKGKIKLKSNYDKIDIRKVASTLNINAIRSTVYVEDYTGNLSIKSRFSKFRLNDIKPTTTSIIEDEFSEIIISQTCFDCYAYLFDFEKSEFSFPKNVKVNYLEQEQQKVRGFIFDSTQTESIKIKSNTSIISLQKRSN